MIRPRITFLYNRGNRKDHMASEVAKEQSMTSGGITADLKHLRCRRAVDLENPADIRTLSIFCVGI